MKFPFLSFQLDLPPYTAYIFVTGLIQSTNSDLFRDSSQLLSDFGVELMKEVVLAPVSKLIDMLLYVLPVLSIVLSSLFKRAQHVFQI